jgi:hypothetical protein
VDKLQNPSSAKRYFVNPSLLSDESFVYSQDIVRKLIEGRELGFVTKANGRARRFREGSPVKAKKHH